MKNLQDQERLNSTAGMPQPYINADYSYRQQRIFHTAR